MDNQVEPCSFDLTHFENMHNSQKSNTNSWSQSSIRRFFSPFLNVFLPIIGIQLNLSTVSIYIVIEFN